MLSCVQHIKPWTVVVNSHGVGEPVSGRFIVFAVKVVDGKEVLAQVEPNDYHQAVACWHQAIKKDYQCRVWDRRQERFLEERVLLNSAAFLKLEE
jgi:hypothetical protein